MSRLVLIILLVVGLAAGDAKKLVRRAPGVRLIEGISIVAGDIGAGGEDGVGLEARFNRPLGMAVDHDGNIFVADAGNQAIRRITPKGEVTTFIDMFSACDMTVDSGSSICFDNLGDMVFDQAGMLYVIDGNRVMAISPSGETKYVSDDFIVPSLDAKTGIKPFLSKYNNTARDSAGNVYAINSTGDRLTKTATNGQVRVVAASILAGETASGTIAINNVSAITLDSAGNLYMAEAKANAIRKIALNGVVTTLAGSEFDEHVAIYDDPLPNPSALAIDRSGIAYVATMGASVVGPDGIILPDEKHRFGDIFRVAPDGEVALFSHLVGRSRNTESGWETSAHPEEREFALDAKGNLYVSYEFESAIHRITPNGKNTLFAGKPDEEGDVDGPAAKARFSRPRGMAFDRHGALYVADSGSGTIRKIALDGVVSTYATMEVASVFITDNHGRMRQLVPKRLAFDSIGNLYALLQSEERLRTNPVMLIRIAHEGKSAKIGAPITLNLASNPAIAINSHDQIYLSTGDTIMRVSPSGEQIVVAGRHGSNGSAVGKLPASLSIIDDLAFDDHDVLYALATSALLRIQLPAQ